MEQVPISSHENNIRNEQEVNSIINESILETVAVFNENMSDRDRQMLESVAREESPGPKARVMHLLQIQSAAGVSENLKDHINQILLTLRQQLTPKEQEKFRGWGAGQNMLNDIS
jgi:hypothetical protein